MAYRSWSNLSRLTNLKVSVDRSGSVAHVLLPGLSLDHFDRTRTLNATKLQNLLTGARFFAYHTPNEDTGKSFLDYDIMTKDCFTFMASSLTEISRDYYNIPAETPIPGLSVKLLLGYIGNSSLNSVATVVGVESEKVYARNVNQVVSVDKNTRKPMALPDWWKEKYQGSVSGGERLVCPPVQPPSDRGQRCHEYDMKVPWSDIDGYKHTTYTAYLRYCYDGAMDAVSKNALSKFQGDILNYYTKKFMVLYKGESNAGDPLKVTTWENEENPYILHFDISRNNQSLFQNTIEFYEPLIG